MKFPSLSCGPEDYSLLTDLYQLTMAACYVGEGLDQRRASFELFVRRSPSQFGYLIAAGLAQVLEYLEGFEIRDRHLAALEATGIFAQAPTEFWQRLAGARFTGDVWAVPEGTVMFAQEPLLRIEAPLWQAQLVETYLLNAVNYQTLVATRAARLRDVAGPAATLLEFGSRRAFSPQGALWAARAAIAGGLDGTSNVLAALTLGQKPVGTMAHALVMAIAATQGSEAEAYRAFQRYFPQAPLLIDTYDAVAAATHLAQEQAQGRGAIAGVRLDSGDLVQQSQQIQAILPGVPIFASGDLDEYEILRLRQQGACLAGYGLGTRLVSGEPVNGVYKLVEIDGIPVMKGSTGKGTYPGRKQVFRLEDPTLGDYLGLMTEAPPPASIALLQPVMRAGQRLEPPEELDAIAQRSSHNVQSLSASVRDILTPASYPVTLSPSLLALQAQCQAQSRWGHPLVPISVPSAG